VCVYSMVVDHYYDDWFQRRWTTTVPDFEIRPVVVPAALPWQVPTQAEIDEFRKLLDRAREYEKRNNEPDCELEEKKARVRKLAEELGIKVDFL
jgi:hypothetical protein